MRKAANDSPIPGGNAVDCDLVVVYAGCDALNNKTAIRTAIEGETAQSVRDKLLALAADTFKYK